MLGYIADYYLKFKLPSMPVTEAAFIICALVIFGDFSGEDKLKRALNYLIGYICLFLPIVILKAVLHTYTDFNLTYVYALVLVPYAFIAGRKRSKINVAVYLFTYWTAYVYATSFAKAIGNLFCTNFGVTETKTVTYIFLAVIVPCVLAACTVMIKKFSLDFFPSLPAYTIIPAIVVDLAANAAKLLVDSVKEEGLPFFGITEAENGAFIFFTGVLLYLLNIFCYAFSYSKAKAIKSDAELKGSLERIKTESELYKSDAANVKENLEEMRQIRHDIKNQFAYMQIFLSQKDYGGLEEYFKEISGGIAADEAFLDVENVTVRNALSLEKYKAKQSGTALEAKTAVPKELRIENKDVTAVIINLIDNAIEAVTEDGLLNAVITVEVIKKRNVLYIKVENPVKDESKKTRRKSLLTAKENKNLHGRGTKIISATAEKYDGVFNYTVSDDKFSAEVMLAEREK